MGKRELAALLSLVYGLCTVCHGMFALPLGVIGRLSSVTVAIPGHLLFYKSMPIYEGCSK